VVCAGTFAVLAPASDPVLAQGAGGGASARSTNLTIVMNGQLLGEVDVRGATTANALIPLDALLDILAPLQQSNPAVHGQLTRLKARDGFVSIAMLRSAGLAARIDRGRLILTREAAAAGQAAPQLQPARFAPAEPATSFSLPVLVNGALLGEVVIQVDRGQRLLIPKAPLIDILMPMFDSDAGLMARLEAMRDSGGHVTVAALQAAGFRVRIDKKVLELKRAVTTTAVAAKSKPRAGEAPTPGRALNIVVPLKEGGALLGEVPVMVGADGGVLIPKAALIDILTPFLEKDDAALGRLEGIKESDGHVTIADLKAAGFDMMFDRSLLELSRGGRQAKAAPSRLNVSGRTISMSVPLKDREVELGDIVVRIEPDDTVRMPKAVLKQKLAGVLNPTQLAKLEALPGVDGQVSLAEIKTAELNMRYDPNLQEVVLLPNVEQRLASDVSVGARKSQVSANLVQPAVVSGYLNVVGGTDYLWRTPNVASLYLDLQSVVRVGGVVLENAGTYVGGIDPNVCPPGAQCNYTHQSGFKRQSSRLVFDEAQSQTRLQLGDVSMLGTSIQRSNDVLGVSLEKTSRIFAPGESIRPSGNGSFTIDRSADVEVVVNGATVQRLRLRPGTYNVRDLPLASGSNDVQLVITDESGAKRTIPFTMFSGDNMLAAGKSEWALNGGLASYFRDGDRAYEDGHYLGSGFYRFGLSDVLTLEAQGKGDQFAGMGGLGLITSTKLGTWGLQGAVSTSDAGLGLAANLNWDVVNFRGLIGSLSERTETLRFAAEYRDPQFRLPGEFVSNASGVLYRQFPYWLRLTSAYTVPLASNVTATLAGRYQLADETKYLNLVPNAVGGARYGVDATLASQFSSSVSGSVTAGYTNEGYLRQLTGQTASDSPELRIMLTLNVRPSEKTRIASSYDSLTRSAVVSGHASSGDGLGRLESDVNLQQNSEQQNATANGAIGYYGNRGEARISQTSGFTGSSIDKYQPTVGDQRTSVRVGSSIAFADGHVGVGQLIRGNGFAVVYPHESLAGKEIAVGDAAAVRARADGLGPAVVPDLPAYTGTSLPVDVNGLPIGYSLGAGTFDVLAPYKAGYALQVGSASSVSAFGTLMRSDSTPVALVSGVAYPADQPQKQITIFTNKAGRFGAEGLAPGRWIIEVKLDSGTLRYELEVPKSADGLLRAGILMPKQGG